MVIVVATVGCFMLFSSPPAHAQASFESQGSVYDPGRSSIPSPCGKLTAPLSGSFAEDPCNLTRDNRSLKYAQDGFGGQKFAVYLEAWWDKEMLPALKKMTAQLHASRVDQTRQIGGMIDGQTLAAIASSEHAQKLESLIEEKPHELSCVAATHTPALAESSRTAEALVRGFLRDLALRAANALGIGPVSDQKARWEEYCEEFQDPDSNNGVSACPNATAGLAMNGDIDIEGVLLKDTIDLGNPHEYKAASALLRNIVQPHIRQKIPDDALNTVTGREWILLQQHLQAIRNIASATVSSIISRRAPTSPGILSGISLKAMRIKAGIPAAKTSLQPSYNEIMLTMTKERFYDPEYFVRMQDDIGAVRQEQASIGSYITMQYADIHKLQEQINALLAARASLKLNAEAKPSRTEQSPLR